MGIIGNLWARYKQIDPVISLWSNATSLYGVLAGGSAVSSLLLTNWSWFWSSLGWAALPIGFMFSFLVLATCIFLAGLGRYFWKGSTSAPTTPASLESQPIRIGLVDEDQIYPPTIAQGPPPPLFGLYLADIHISLGAVQTDHHGEISIRLFNGTDRTFDLVGVFGRITFKAANLISSDPKMKGELPEPTIPSTTVKSVGPMTEWHLRFDQRFPSKEAEKIPEILRGHPLQFDFTDINIQIADHKNPNNPETLKLWDGISYTRAGQGAKSRIVAAVGKG